MDTLACFVEVLHYDNDLLYMESHDIHLSWAYICNFVFFIFNYFYINS